MSSASISSALVAPSASTTASSRRRIHRMNPKTLFTFNNSHAYPFLLRVTNESSRTQVSSGVTDERSESDKIVDGMDFGELCNDFECISSPLVESTARQLARDILELRQGNRALGTYSVSVKYKDPIRSFTGRDKYKRPLWITTALQNPTVRVQEMVMLSTSVLSIKWTIQGKPNSFLAGIGGDLIIRVNSKFTLNQISGQVVEHEELWISNLFDMFGKSYCHPIRMKCIIQMPDTVSFRGNEESV